MIIFLVLQLIALAVQIGLFVALLRTRDTRYLPGILVMLCLCITFMVAFFVTREAA